MKTSKATFESNWAEAMHGEAIALNTVAAPVAQKRAMALADANHDGLLTRTEAWAFMERAGVWLEPGGSVDARGVATDYCWALCYAFSAQIKGRESAAPAEVFYLQLNNPVDARLVEHDDLSAVVRADPDKPTLVKKNLTSSFNTNGDAAKATEAFKKECRAYFDGLIHSGHRMTGFVLSGHSNGLHMLQEVAPHHYTANLDIRAALTALRQENPNYAALMDGCEKVGLLACFQGAMAAGWQKIFPNATIAGTLEYAPDSGAHSSAAIYRAAQEGHEALRRGLDASVVAGLKVQGAPPGLTVRTTDRNFELDRAEKRLAFVVPGFAAAEASIQAALAGQPNPKTNKPFEELDLKALYSVVNSYLLARQSLWIARSNPGGNNGTEAVALRYLQWTRNTLFALRTHGTLPAPMARPASFSSALP